MAAPTHPPRRTYLVDTRFQLKYTAVLVFCSGAIMSLFGFAMMREVNTNSDLLEGKRIEQALAGAAGKVPALTDFHDALATTDHRMMLVILGTSLLTAAALGLLGILITHKVAGPVLVLSRYAQSLGEGRFPRMRALRTGDELKSFFEVFRTSIEKLRERQAAEAAQLEEMATKLSGPVADELRAIAKAKREALGDPPAALPPTA